MAQQGERPQIEASTQQYLPIQAIKEGVAVLKDHSLKSIIMVSSVNFALKSEEEKDAVISSYQSFLNSLEFPIQIVAASRKLDLTNYLDDVRKTSTSLKSPLLKIQADEYVSFIGQLLEYSNIMEKRFYVVVPYYPGGSDGLQSSGLFGSKKQTPVLGGSFEESKKRLSERVEIIMQGLTSMNLRCAALGTEDMLELFYTIYNPDTAKNQKVGASTDIDVAMIKAEGEK
jgi:hypothetical protein